MRKREDELKINPKAIDKLFKLETYEEILEKTRDRMRSCIVMSDSDLCLEAEFAKIRLLIINGKVEESAGLLTEIDTEKMKLGEQIDSYTSLEQEIEKARRKNESENSESSNKNCELFNCAIRLMERSQNYEAEACFKFLDEHKPDYSTQVSDMRKLIPLLVEVKMALRKIENSNLSTSSNSYRSASKLARKAYKALPNNYHALMAMTEDKIRRPESENRDAPKRLLDTYAERPEAQEKLARLFTYRESVVDLDTNPYQKVKLMKKACLHMLTRQAILELTGQPIYEARCQAEEIKEELELAKEWFHRKSKLHLATVQNKDIARKLFHGGKYREAKGLIDRIIASGQADHAVYVWRFEIALKEMDSNTAHEMFSLISENLGGTTLHNYHCSLTKLERSSSPEAGGKIGASGNERGPSIRGSSIWSTLGSRMPRNKFNAKATYYKKQGKS